MARKALFVLAASRRWRILPSPVEGPNPIQRSAYHPAADGTSGAFWRPELWERVNLVDDELFWERLNRRVFQGGIPSTEKLARFEGFCENYRMSPDKSVKTAGGQLLCPLGNFPGLDAKPVHELRGFPWAAEFERRSTVVATEYKAFQRQMRDRGWTSRDHLAKHWAGSDFQKVSLAMERVYRPDALEHFPRTMRLIEDLDLVSMREVALNKQAPGSGLIAHSDKFNYMLTGHLGVSVPTYSNQTAPAMCGLEINGTVKSWTEGKLLVIDNSFMHRTWNDSPKEPRVILYFDFWHPDLSEEERRALAIFRRTFKERSVEKEKERLDSARALNRLFGV